MTAEILIVDDNADIRNIINELIIDAGYKTRIAANYNQALAEIDKKLPDVALLDVKLIKEIMMVLNFYLILKLKIKMCQL
jgi:two-component system nitrogen regulation response regulator NtrX